MSDRMLYRILAGVFLGLPEMQNIPLGGGAYDILDTNIRSVLVDV